MNRREHWNHVYETKGQEDISWHQAKPAISLRLIEAAGVSKGEPIVDVGSGTSMLIDCLLDAEFNDLTVLDISGAALEQARNRLGLVRLRSLGSKPTSRPSRPLDHFGSGTIERSFTFSPTLRTNGGMSLDWRARFRLALRRSSTPSPSTARRSAADCPLPGTTRRACNRSWARALGWSTKRMKPM